MESAETTCPRYHRAVELVGARWSGAILRALLEGRHRFAEMKAYVPGLSDTMLAQRLRELEAEGVIERRVEPSIPVRVTYHLTPKGEALGPVVRALEDWAHTWIDDASRHPVA